MATITKTMKQDALDAARQQMYLLRRAGTKAGADRALGGANALANFAQVWSIITPSEAESIRNMAALAHKAWCATQRAKGGTA